MNYSPYYNKYINTNGTERKHSESVGGMPSLLPLKALAYMIRRSGLWLAVDG